MQCKIKDDGISAPYAIADPGSNTKLELGKAVILKLNISTGTRGP